MRYSFSYKPSKHGQHEIESVFLSCSNMAPVMAVPAPSRKQNVACDACRTKKVRCLRETITETVSNLNQVYW